MRERDEYAMYGMLSRDVDEALKSLGIRENTVKRAHSPPFSPCLSSLIILRYLSIVFPSVTRRVIKPCLAPTALIPYEFGSAVIFPARRRISGKDTFKPPRPF